MLLSCAAGLEGNLSLLVIFVHVFQGTYLILNIARAFSHPSTRSEVSFEQPVQGGVVLVAGPSMRCTKHMENNTRRVCLFCVPCLAGFKRDTVFLGSLLPSRRQTTMLCLRAHWSAYFVASSLHGNTNSPCRSFRIS